MRCFYIIKNYTSCKYKIFSFFEQKTKINTFFLKKCGVTNHRLCRVEQVQVQGHHVHVSGYLELKFGTEIPEIVVFMQLKNCINPTTWATSPSPKSWGTKTYVVREESRHREKKGGSQVTARARERERRRYRCSVVHIIFSRDVISEIHTRDPQVSYVTQASLHGCPSCFNPAQCFSWQGIQIRIHSAPCGQRIAHTFVHPHPIWVVKFCILVLGSMQRWRCGNESDLLLTPVDLVNYKCRARRITTSREEGR